MATVSLSKWVGRALCHGGGMSQAELARQLETRLKRAYDRSMVNKMVLGTREVGGDEMLAISHITGYPAPEVAATISQVPMLSWVSAGSLADAQTQIPVEDVPLLAFADLGRGDFFALKVVGDSMDRLSPDNSVIVINRDDRLLVPDKPYVFARRGETTYKLWQPDPPHLAPFSTNPSHRPIFVKGKKEFEVIGRVKRTVLDL